MRDESPRTTTAGNDDEFDRMQTKNGNSKTMDQCSSPEAVGNDEHNGCSKEGGETNESMETSDEAVNDVLNHYPPIKKQKRQNGNNITSNDNICGSPPPPALPNKVTFDPIRKLFRLRKSKGKTLAAGGFGVSIRISPEEQAAEEEQEQDKMMKQQTHLKADNGSRNNDDNDNKELNMVNGHSGETTGLNAITRPLDTNADTSYTAENTTTRATIIIRKEFLFVEEVIFLYERGLMDVYDENNVRLNDTPHCIYNLLERLGMSLPLYLVYAHARQQSYRVVRHGTAARQEILKEMEKLKQEWPSTQSSSSSSSATIAAAGAEPVTESNAAVTAKKAVAAVSASQGGPSPPSQDWTKDLAMESTTATTGGESGTKEEELDQRVVITQNDTAINHSSLHEQPISHEYRVTTPDGTPLFLRSMKLLEQRLRDEVAPPPKAAFLSSSSSSSSASTTSNNEDPNTLLLPPLAWDVYLPDVTFQRSRPGLPAFSILVTHYAAVAGASSRRACFAQYPANGDDGKGKESSSSFLSFSQMQALALANRPVPIKIATVSDSGTVVVFGVCAPSFGSGNDDDAHALVPSIAGKDSNVTTDYEKVVPSS